MTSMRYALCVALVTAAALAAPPAGAGDGPPSAATPPVTLAVRARQEQGRARFAARDHAEAESLFKEALALLDAGPAADEPTLRAALHLDLAQAQYQLGKTGQAVGSYRAAAALSRALGDRRQEADCLLGATTGLLVLGRYDEALAAGLAAQRIADELALPGQGSQASHLAGMIHRNLRQYPEALACLRRAADLARSAGDAIRLIRALNEEGNVLHLSGETELAMARKREAVALARETGDERALSDCLNDLAVVAMDRDDYAAARAYLEEAYAISSRIGDPRERIIASANLAGVIGYLGETARARTLIDEALALSLERDVPEGEEIARAALAYTLNASGKTAEAYKHLDRAYQLRQARLAAESARRAADLRALYDAERREAEIELLKRDRAIQELTLARQRVRQRALLAAFAAAALFAAALGTGWRMKVRSARALAAAKRRVEELARTDPLTGLANRRHAIERMRDEARRAQRGQAAFALVLADIDHFKRINDTHSHACGDHVLTRVAEMVSAHVRALDLAARWGGEEFLLILPGTDRNGAVTLAEKVRGAVAEGEIHWNGDRITVTATFGVSECVDGDFESALRTADAALYRGKEGGRNTVVAAV